MSKRLFSWYVRLDRIIMHFLHERSLTILRVSLGIVFLWFGGLKVTGYSPVVELVEQTVFWMPSSWSVPIIGWWEVLIGVGLIAGRSLRSTLLLMLLQQIGTFMVLFLLPEQSFQGGNPLLLTLQGEFVVKNIVLVSAGLVVGASLDIHREAQRASGKRA